MILSLREVQKLSKETLRNYQFYKIMANRTVKEEDRLFYNQQTERMKEEWLKWLDVVDHI